MFETWYVKGVPFVNGKYKKGVLFLSKMVYKRVRGWTAGRSLPTKTLLGNSPGRSGQAQFSFRCVKLVYLLGCLG